MLKSPQNGGLLLDAFSVAMGYSLAQAVETAVCVAWHALTTSSDVSMNNSSVGLSNCGGGGDSIACFCFTFSRGCRLGRRRKVW